MTSDETMIMYHGVYDNEDDHGGVANNDNNDVYEDANDEDYEGDGRGGTIPVGRFRWLISRLLIPRWPSG